MVLTSQRIFIDAIKKYCLAHDIAFEVRSGGWLIVMQRDERRRLTIGYDIGLNGAVAHQVANDKAATSEVLTLAGVPCIPHTLFLGPKLSAHVPGSGSRQAMLELLRRHPRGVVVKPNGGTSGEQVFRVRTEAQLDAAVTAILSAHPSLAISPYVEIEDEVRVVLLDERPLIVYGKRRPSVVGDGTHSLRELARAAASDSMVDDPDDADPDAVVPKGERKIVGWKHNLDLGAEPVLLSQGDARDNCVALATAAAQAIGLRFGSIDVVRTGSAWQILEVNAGVKMEALGRRHPDLVYAAYGAALDRLFG